MVVNGVITTWMVDTGAARAVVNKKEAVRLGLEPSSTIVELVGVGTKTARQAKVVKMGWRGRSCKVKPYIIESLSVPGLLGMEEATKLGMVIRPATREVGVSIVSPEVSPSKLVTQPPLPLPIVATEVSLEKDELMKGKISEDLGEDQRERVWKVLEKHRKVWTSPQFGKVKTKAHFIPIDRPVKDKLRPMSLELRGELDKQLDELLTHRVIRPSKSPWASSPVFVRKADGSWRMALDYRRVNKRIKTDGYPIPLLWEQLQLAANHLYYARLDGKSGFFNVPLTESSKELTAFNSHRGLFEYNVLPFGIKNSPGEFQRVMDTILSELYGKGVLCYIDDIVIYSNEFESFVSLIDEVFSKLWDGGVYIEPKKCEFGSKEIALLGHLLCTQGIKPNPKKVEAIRAAKAPGNRKELMSFLGLIGFVRRFIPHYSDRTAALSSLLKKNAKFNWSEECQVEFERLRCLVVDHVLLSAPMGQGPYILFCDASDLAIGVVLCQWQLSAVHILEFASKKFSAAELNWSTREKEAFAIKWSVQKFECYLKGAKVYVLTDHSSLQWMDTASSGKVQRWALYLQQFDVRVRAIKGVDNGMADWLSRAVTSKDMGADEEIEEISVPVFNVEDEVSDKNVTPHFNMCPYLPTLEQWIEASKEIPEQDKKFLMSTKEGLWCSIRGRKAYVPERLRESLLYWFHASNYGGHFGINKTARRLNKWFFWPNQKADVSKYVNSCLPCRRTGVPGVRYLRQVLERAEPFQLVSLDYVGPREWRSEKLHYLVIIDHFSRFIVTKVVTAATTGGAITALKESWMSHFGAPEAVLVDRGAAFISRPFQNFVRNELSATIVYTGAGYPQGNSINEAAHKGLEASISTRLLYDNVSSFSDVLNDAVLAYNSTPHSATGMSPFCMLFGKEMILPGLQRFRSEVPEEVRRSRIKDAQFQASCRAILMEDKGLKLMSAEPVKVGDQVVYYLQEHEVGTKALEEGRVLIKYTPHWSTPVEVVGVGKNTVEVLNVKGVRCKISNRLIRKISSDVPPSLKALSVSNVQHELSRIRTKPQWAESAPRKLRIVS